MATRHETNLAVHPGVYLREELEAHGLTQAALAKRMGRPLQLVNALCRERRSINAATALDLESVLDLSASTWLGLQAKYDLTRERNRRGEQVPA